MNDDGPRLLYPWRDADSEHAHWARKMGHWHGLYICAMEWLLGVVDPFEFPAVCRLTSEELESLLVGEVMSCR